MLGGLTYVLLSINPIGGLLIAIPFAMFELKYPAWVTFLIALPCCYVQVVVVDLGWTQLNRWQWFKALLERMRSPRIERLVATGGAFVPTMVAAPFIGPWVVMAFMRYAHVAQRRVALPILIGMSCQAIILISVCIFAPQLLSKHAAHEQTMVTAPTPP